MPPFHPTCVLRQNNTRFISEAKARIGKCITFGCSTASQFEELSRAVRTLNQNWRRFAVGNEGYVTDPSRAGLLRHRIAWGDHDQMGHVNNVVYNFWAETGRINWARNLAMQVEDNAAQRAMWEDLLTPRGIGLILRSIKTDYKFPLQYPDRVTVIHKLLQEPKSGMDSLHLEAVILSETHQRIAAKVTEDIAVYDYRIRKKAPLPDFMVDTLKEEWENQKKAKQAATSLLGRLDGRIKDLEQETWDREDAVEDMGAAAKKGAPSAAASEKPIEAQPEETARATKLLSKKARGLTSDGNVRSVEGDETPLEYQVSMQKR